MTQVLRELAHARAGDKGDTLMISVIAYRSADYSRLVSQMTAERVARHFQATVRGEVRRIEAPAHDALVFIMEKALGGGVTSSLALDAHGKSLGPVILSMEIDDL